MGLLTLFLVSIIKISQLHNNKQEPEDFNKVETKSLPINPRHVTLSMSDFMEISSLRFT